jgi:hypothetical protein
MTTAASYITEYIARRAPYDMVAPSRHRNLLVRALWWKQERWEQEAIVEACAKPSAEFDEAFDAMFDADEKWEAIIRDAWSYRAVSRDVRVAA